MVSEKARSDQEAEEERSGFARKEEDLRKRILEKEKEIARIMQEAEEERQGAVEGAEVERQEVRSECDLKVVQMRAEQDRMQQELRAKMNAKEKDLMSKIDGLRNDNIRAQEQFQNDLKEKEASFQRRLDQEKSLQAQVDSLMSSTSIKEMQAKVAAVTEQLRAARGECDKGAERETGVRRELEVERREAAQMVQVVREAEQEVISLQQHMSEKQAELDALAEQHRQLGKKMCEVERQLAQSKEMQTNLIRQFEGSHQDLDAAKARHKEVAEAAGAAQRDMVKYQKECKRLEQELGEASQALIKRGDEFSETMSLLQGRFDAESRNMHEKLRVSNATNARLAAELEESSTLLLMFKDQTSGTQQAVEELYQKKLDAAEQELKQANDTYQDRLGKAQQVAQAELLNAKERVEENARSRVKLSEDRCVWLEEELHRVQQQQQQQHASLIGHNEGGDSVKELERRLERVERENNTLTEELDNILAENAQLRSELDNRMDGSPGTMTTSSVDDDMSSAASSYGAARIHTLLGSMGSSMGGKLGVITCGVHTSRLLRAAFFAWTHVTVEQRMT